jgi:hypothetical protein
MTIMVLFPFVVKLSSSGPMSSVAAEGQIFLKKRPETEFHIFLGFVAIYRRFDLAQDYAESVSRKLEINESFHTYHRAGRLPRAQTPRA